MSEELPPVLEKLLLALEAALNSVLHTLPLAPYPAMASLLHSMQMQQANAMDPMSEEMMGGIGLPTGPAWQ